MSASEKLQALEDDRRRWIEGDLIPMSAGLKLVKALPELVAVVKKAEQECDYGGCHICGRYDPPDHHSDDCALFALEKALK